jgi:hypothetical protein
MLGFRLADKATALVLAFMIAASTFATEAVAQATEEDWQLLVRLVEASNSVSAETAREAHKECVAIGKEIAARKDMDPTQRLYFESEVESCIAYAMNNGQFSDETGDECSHHFRFAQLLRDSIQSAQNKPGLVQEQFDVMRDRLQRASELGPDMGCKGDYEGLIASLPATDAIAAGGAFQPNEELLRRFANVTNDATGDAAGLASCRQLDDEVYQNSNLHTVEHTYFEALFQDCLARAMIRGAAADEVGDACVHHHLFATHLATTLMIDKEAPFFDEHYRLAVGYELETAMRQGPEMGCTQDYAALKVD